MKSSLSTHLFILRRYAIENYLLEPDAVFEEFKMYPIKDEFKEKINTLRTMEKICLNCAIN